MRNLTPRRVALCRHAFLLVDGDGTRHVFCAENDEEREAWVEVLALHIEMMQPTSLAAMLGPDSSPSGRALNVTVDEVGDEELDAPPETVWRGRGKWAGQGTGQGAGQGRGAGQGGGAGAEGGGAGQPTLRGLCARCQHLSPSPRRPPPSTRTTRRMVMTPRLLLRWRRHPLLRLLLLALAPARLCRARQRLLRRPS